MSSPLSVSAVFTCLPGDNALISVLQSCTSVSPVFYRDAGLRPEPVDLKLMSSDATSFFVHVSVLLAKSSNNFGDLLRLERLRQYATNRPPSLAIGSTATVLNVVLHVIYDVVPLPHNVDLQDLITAVDALAFCGVSLREHAHRDTPLFQLLATHMAAAPIDVYALAASHNLHDMAVLSSSYTLDMRARDISEDQALRMGVHYLRRLIDLQLRRTGKLKELLRRPPTGHLPTETCSIASQERLARAWLMSGAYFLWDAVPGTFLSGTFITLFQLIRRSNQN